MVQVMCFMKLNMGATEEVVSKLRAIPQVKEIYFITGEYDLVVMLNAKDGDELHYLFANNLEKIPGIVSSASHLVMKHWTKGCEDP